MLLVAKNNCFWLLYNLIIYMDTEIQEWYCKVCKKYSLKREDKHLLTRIHEINQARLDRMEAYEDYMMRRYYILMENTGVRPFSKYLERSALVYRIIKKEFNRNYKVTD